MFPRWSRDRKERYRIRFRRRVATVARLKARGESRSSVILPLCHNCRGRALGSQTRHAQDDAPWRTGRLCWPLYLFRRRGWGGWRKREVRVGCKVRSILEPLGIFGHPNYCWRSWHSSSVHPLLFQMAPPRHQSASAHFFTQKGAVLMKK